MEIALSRSLRLALIVLGIVAIIAGLGYAAHVFNVVGMITNAHVPPRHGS